MEADTYSHSAYFKAFQQFMKTGEKDAVATYLESSRPATFLSVYRNGFIRASASALESNFPCLVKLWGEDYFSQMASAYVNLAPSSSATLIAYGFDVNFDQSSEPSTLSFIEFLKQNHAEVIDQYPYVIDMCRLDQAWFESLNENGESFLSLSVVQDMISRGEDLAELPLKLVDSTRLVDLEYNVFELWGQLRFGELAKNQTIELEENANSVIFWQKDLQVQAKPMSAIEAVFIQSLNQSRDIDTASNDALAKDEDFDISTLFAELLTAHLLQQ